MWSGVAGSRGKKVFRARLIAGWNRSRRRYRCLVTNLPRNRYPPRRSTKPVGFAGESNPDYTRGSTCDLGSMEIRARASRKPVIPRHSRENGEKAGIHLGQKSLDSRFRGNDGLKKTIHLIFVRNQESICSSRIGGAPARPSSSARSGIELPKLLRSLIERQDGRTGPGLRRAAMSCSTLARTSSGASARTARTWNLSW